MGEVASLIESGRDPAAVRAAIGRIDRLGAAPRGARQAFASEMCEWLRFALGPGRTLDPEHAQLDDLAYEVLAVLVQSLRDPAAAASLCGLDLDLSATVLERADFSRVHLTDGTVDFSNCSFGSQVSFADAQFLGACVVFDGSVFTGSSQRAGGYFSNATFSGSDVSFRDAVFTDGTCRFDDANFQSGHIRFDRVYSSSTLSFIRCRFSEAIVTFFDGVFQDGSIAFSDCKITGGELRFDRIKIRADMTLARTAINGGLVSFDDSEVSGSVSFGRLALTAGSLTTRNTVVTSGGIDFRHMVVGGGSLVLDGTQALFGTIDMSYASFVSGTVSLHEIRAPYDGIIHLPWATYTRGRTQVVDESFDVEREHDFTVVSARYRPGVVRDWGSLRP